jgi:AcrR family transcriptional regulator
MSSGSSARRTEHNGPRGFEAGMVNTRTTPRQARSAKSLDLILDAAERLLQDRGVVETSTVDVATAAGVSVGRLYYWFPDKDAVVRAVLTRAENRLRILLVDLIVEDSEQPSPELLNRLLPAVGGFFREHRGSLAVLQRGPMDDADPGLPLRELFVGLIATAVESRVPDVATEERDLVANTVVRIIIAMLGECVRADEQQSAVYLHELEYVVSSYLRCRYPHTSE